MRATLQNPRMRASPRQWKPSCSSPLISNFPSCPFQTATLLSVPHKAPDPSLQVPEDDYYGLLLSSPLPSSHPDRAGAPSPLTPSTRTPVPTTASKPDVRIIFGSRLAGAGRSLDPDTCVGQDALLEQGRPQEPDNCCMSGCVNCVWDQFREDIEAWALARRKREGRDVRPDRGDGKVTTLDATHEEKGNGNGIADLDGPAGLGDLDGTASGMDEKLFENVPIGIREFMNTEKRLKKKRLSGENNKANS